MHMMKGMPRDANSILENLEINDKSLGYGNEKKLKDFEIYALKAT